VLTSFDSKTKCTTVLEYRSTEEYATAYQISLLIPLDNALSATFDASSFSSHVPIIREFESSIASSSAAVGSPKQEPILESMSAVPSNNQPHPSLETPTSTPSRPTFLAAEAWAQLTLEDQLNMETHGICGYAEIEDRATTALGDLAHHGGRMWAGATGGRRFARPLDADTRETVESPATSSTNAENGTDAPRSPVTFFSGPS